MHMRKFAALNIFISFAICLPVFANSDNWTYSPPGSYEQAISISKETGDRKSTRLNSSHQIISYAVFCLKKKKQTSEIQSHLNLVCHLLLEIERAQLSYIRTRQ